MLQLSEVSQGLGCDAVGHGGHHVPACKLLRHWQCGLRSLGDGKRHHVGWSCVFHWDPLLEASPC